MPHLNSRFTLLLALVRSREKNNLCVFPVGLKFLLREYFEQTYYHKVVNTDRNRNSPVICAAAELLVLSISPGWMAGCVHRSLSTTVDSDSVAGSIFTQFASTRTRRRNS